MQKIFRRIWTTQIVTEAEASFGRGLNVTADVSQLQEGELRRADNCRLTIFNAVQKRLGTKRMHTLALSGGLVQGGFSWSNVSPVQDLVIAGGNLYTGNAASIPVTWTNRTSGLSSTGSPAFAAFRDASADVVYIADGSLSKWNGTTATVGIASTPSVKVLAVQNLRLFGAGDTTNPQRLYFSPFSNGDLLGDNVTQFNNSFGGFADIRTFGHQRITGLASVGQSLLIFHERGISRFTGWSPEDFDIESGTRGLTADVGTIAPHTIVEVENTVYFLSDRGVYAATESGVDQISQPIEKVLSTATGSLFPNAWAVHDRLNREVWFNIPDEGTYVYNYRLGAWSGPWDTIFNQSSAAWVSGPASTPVVLLGGADGFVRQANLGAKDDVLADGTSGVAYTMAAQARRLFFGDPTAEKALRFMYVQVDTGGSTACAVSWSTVTSSGTRSINTGNEPIWGVSTWGHFTWGSVGSISNRVQVDGRGTFVDTTFLDSSDNATPVFSRIEVEGFDYGRRGSQLGAPIALTTITWDTLLVLFDTTNVTMDHT